MCELLVWVHDREDGGNPEHDAVKYRRGDVIVAVPDGHPWGTDERGDPRWVVLCVPTMPLAEGQALATEEPAAPGRLPHTRLFGLDLDSPAAHASVKSLVARADAGVNLPAEVIDAAHLRAIRRKKAPAPDPRVIGPADSNVIG